MSDDSDLPRTAPGASPGDLPLDKTEDAIRRGAAARRLLDDPLLVESFAAVADDLERRWRDSAPAESAARERLWLMQRLLGQVREHLNAAIAGGVLARRKLDEIDRRRKFALGLFD